MAVQCKFPGGTLIFDDAFYSCGIEALHILNEAGFEAFFVGGMVRDAFLGRPTHDVDITTNAPYEEMCSAFQHAGWPTYRTGEKHGTLTVICNNTPLEITHYRHECCYSDHRHPDLVSYTSDLNEDLARRDFTLNAMAFHPDFGLIDPFQGLQDASKGIIRCVGDANLRFQEDALRILRACRFSSQLGFSLDPATAQAIHENRSLLACISAERTQAELSGLLCGSRPFPVLMEFADVIFEVIPELQASWKFDQNTPYHKYDVYEHIAHTVEHIDNTPLNRWVALLHDCGKPARYTCDENGVGHFKGHAKVSERLARAIAQRLKMPREFTDDLLLLILHHDDVIQETPKAVKRAMNKLGGRPELFESLCAMKQADTLSQADRCLPRLEMIENLRSIASGILEENEAFTLKQLDLSGDDLLALGLKPGPQFSELLQAALDAVIDEECINNKAALINYLGLS